MLYKSLVRPLLFRKDAERSHEQILALLSHLEFLYGSLNDFYRVKDDRLRVQIGPLTFPNPVGLAAGFDKNAVAPKALSAFGFGFMEIGAVTAQAQPGNPKPRLYRLPEDHALINRLGFNNKGAEAIALKLERLRARSAMPEVPLGINIGRSKIVETKDAVADFLAAFERLFPYGDFFTLNVSSPNTPNLRDLQGETLLRELLAPVQEKNRALATRAKIDSKPLFVKIAPDMEFSQVDAIIDVVEAVKLTGIIATNATAFMREGLKSPAGREPGGLSGRPITKVVTSFVSHIFQVTQGRLPIIGVGGIFNAEDAYDKIKAGASAVQIYTGWVYEGPGAVKRINRGLLSLLERDGLKHLSDAVGMESRSTNQAGSYKRS
ncbi:MAG: quinone-dependent dihydroorotate dehydrogenase [Deltaproteobacteria bacterium]|nr:quinone-dependent dihydroorotate dehydrogenase [Deltaproteobacteria bacterium]MBI2231798.1 quinone-dependent dihydroorotate dehydrogenase [Deltaproteobacteria bacterium]MBI2365691.1 quinone-dependent dihydroorotate dehydrogenase [Deltaproteobacteria bacterium]MBI2533849.1 quinone-dependent dihydroorotate dehydrogenase [Deltaproteobacteria bacterium]